MKEDCEEEKEEDEETLMEEELSPGNRTASFDLWLLVKVVVAIMMTMHLIAQTILDGLDLVPGWRDDAALSIFSQAFLSDADADASLWASLSLSFGSRRLPPSYCSELKTPPASWNRLPKQ